MSTITKLKKAIKDAKIEARVTDEKPVGKCTETRWGIISITMEEDATFNASESYFLDVSYDGTFKGDRAEAIESLIKDIQEGTTQD